MLDIQNYAGFLVAILVFQAVPGAGTVAILNATARGGRRTGFAAVAGTLLGDFLYMLGALAGLAAVMHAHPHLFQALQWVGALYLVWLGWELLRRPAASASAAPRTVPEPAACFRQAFAVALTNPKVMLFFVSFFPLFLRPDASPLTLAAMVAHVTVISLAWQALLVLLGNALAGHLAGWPGARQLITRLGGATLIGLGIKLASDNR